MLGTLTLPALLGKYYVVTGGPYTEVNEDYLGVKMAAEIKRPCAIDIPTLDFSVPNYATLDKGLREAVTAILAGTPVYVGCMAGRGRTGLFMAILAKAFGVKDPIQYVRKNYYSHAVETEGQAFFVENFIVPSDVWAAIHWARFRSLFRLTYCLTKLPE